MIIIGEKVNGAIPKTGKAIAEHDEDYIKYLVKAQSEVGVNYLDCCASVQDGELETLEWLIGLIQGESDTPICIDSPSPQACIDAIKFCKRPGIINSVSMEGDKIDTVFPVIADTDWKCVALLCDDKGLPRTAEARIDVLKRTMARAEEFGIAQDRLFIDPLVETLGANPDSYRIFADTCIKAKELYPDIHITSGLSNISFGLPVRKVINMAFLALAMDAGMDSAIVDPLNRDFMGVIFASDALIGNDEYCEEYLDAYRNNIFGPVKA